MPRKTSEHFLKKKLNARGWRLTPQRDIILQVFQNLPKGKYLSAEELDRTLAKREQAVSLSTIYRTLKIMTRLGILRELELVEGHKLYELKTLSSHYQHHLICIQCNKIIQFQNDLILNQALNQVETAGLKMTDCHLTVYTICPEARRLGWPGSISCNWTCHIY
jgi:Fur family transcriptional regulator, ferric uptake regulator